jgi:hypothetical protein
MKIFKVKIMNKNILYFLIMISFLLFNSCVHARSTTQTFSIKSGLKIVSGRAILNIHGQVTENLYPYVYDGRNNDYNSYDNPIARDGSITKNETKYLSSGEEYKFSLLPTEVVTINVTSLNDDDVQIMTYDHGREKNYIVKGTDKLGILISFQNR